MPRQENKGKSPSGSKSVKLGPGFPPQLLNRLLRSQRRCIPFRNTFPTMYNKSRCSQGIPNKSDNEQKYNNFRFSSPKAATDMGVSSSESHDFTLFYKTSMAGFGVLLEIHQKSTLITGFWTHNECGTSRGSKPVCIGDLRMGLISCLQWHDSCSTSLSASPSSSSVSLSQEAAGCSFVEAVGRAVRQNLNGNAS